MGSITYISHDGAATRLEASDGLSVMQVATSNGLPGIDADCGGSLSCATCHVRVDAGWFAAVGEPGDEERAMLELAESPGPTSRLSCQIRWSEALDGLVVHLPESQ